ncbi:MAG: hypothetical protein ACXVA9_03865 [Bdellovibrionales bacterium]
MTNPVILSHSVYASVAHRYWNAQWSEAKNREVYGQDASTEGIGSNLRLELSVRAADGVGEADLLMALNQLKSMVDHQCLFAKDSEFGAKSSTLENITSWLSRALTIEWSSLTVWESERLGCIVQPSTSEPALIFKRGNLALKISRAVDSLSGIAVERAAVDRAVGERLVKLNENNDTQLSGWSRKLFLDLQNSLAGLCSLTIDLGSHESLVVHS